jgi:hypothetical protein
MRDRSPVAGRARVTRCSRPPVRPAGSTERLPAPRRSTGRGASGSASGCGSRSRNRAPTTRPPESRYWPPQAALFGLRNSLCGARSGIDGCEHGATLNRVGRPAGSSFFPRPVGNRTSGLAELLSRPAEDLTAGRKSNAPMQARPLPKRHDPQCLDSPVARLIAAWKSKARGRLCPTSTCR